MLKVLVAELSKNIICQVKMKCTIACDIYYLISRIIILVRVTDENTEVLHSIENTFVLLLEKTNG